MLQKRKLVFRMSLEIAPDGELQALHHGPKSVVLLHPGVEKMHPDMRQMRRDLDPGSRRVARGPRFGFTRTSFGTAPIPLLSDAIEMTLANTDRSVCLRYLLQQYSAGLVGIVLKQCP